MLLRRASQLFEATPAGLVAWVAPAALTARPAGSVVDAMITPRLPAVRMSTSARASEPDLAIPPCAGPGKQGTGGDHG
jgi:hypothetical protein